MFSLHRLFCPYKDVHQLPPPESLAVLWDHPWPGLRLIGLRLQRMERPQGYP
jgi:hypothetical protein